MDNEKIKNIIEEFLAKMTVADLTIELNLPKKEGGLGSFLGFTGFSKKEDVLEKEEKKSIDINIKLKEPQFLIGQNGQTLAGLQKILGMILNKKLGENFYLNLDVNDYKKSKTEFLKNLAKNYADKAVFTGAKQVLRPMSSYERRIIHTELSLRKDVAVKSEGDGFDRHIVIEPL